MNVSTATALCRNLMTEHGVGYLQLGYADVLYTENGKGLAAGQTNYMRTFQKDAAWIANKITLSLPWIKHLPEFKVEELILHEIAHAKCAYGVKHGLAWQDMCLRLGIQPNRTFKYPTLPPELERYR